MASSPHNFQAYTINTFKGFQNLQAYVTKLNPELVILDVEADSEIEKKAKLYGIGLCFTEHKSFFISWRNQSGQEIFNQEQQKFISDWIFQIGTTSKLIGHNIIYDVLVLENNLGIDLSPYIYSDTILLKHTLNEEPPFALKEIAKIELGEWAVKAQDELKESVLKNGGKWTKDQKDMYKADTTILANYCCWDVMLTYLLFQKFEVELKKQDLQKLFYEDEIMPLYKIVTIDMKRHGFPINVEYFIKLKSDIEQEISNLEDAIMISVKDDIEYIENNRLNNEFPIKNSGTLPVAMAEVLNIPLPVNKKTGKVTLAEKALKLQIEANPKDIDFYNWILAKANFVTLLPSNDKIYSSIPDAQRKLFFKKNPDKRYVFNLSSNDDLIELIVKKWGYPALEETETGKPQVDADFINYLAEQHTDNKFFQKLNDYKKLNKLLSTYIDGILDRQIEGIIYTSMLQFGTTSGRYSSRNPNCQNLPRVKEEDSGLSELVLKYTNAIKEGFIAGKGHKIVNADYSSLEPVCFAHVSNENKIRNVFTSGEDLYSRIAIDVLGIDNVSANKKDVNYLKNVMPEARQKAKVFCLAVVYGAQESRIKEAMNVSWQEARTIIQAYLRAYPNLNRYMRECDKEAKTRGRVKTELGRVRHLEKASLLYTMYNDDIAVYKWAEPRGLVKERREYKNLLNNAKNFKIQGLAAHIVNRSAIAMNLQFKKENLSARVRLQVHDELTVIAKESEANRVAEIMKDCMENTTKISVPLSAVPIIGDNWAESK